MKPLYLLFPFLFMSLLILQPTDQYPPAPVASEKLFSQIPFYPEEELPVHIAGGFFSVFDRRQGHTSTGELMFRLTGCSGGAEWCLLCRVGSFGTPTLKGFVFRKGPFGICRRICGFTIKGRGEKEAEGHLQKVVTPVTRIHGDVGRN
jgi:hypothetical protein